MDEVKKHFKPEFLGRIDQISVFKPLDADTITQIVSLHLDDLFKRTALQGYTIEASEELKTWLAKKSFDAPSGARKVRKVLRDEVEDFLIPLMLSGELKKGKTITLSEEGEKIIIK